MVADIEETWVRLKLHLNASSAFGGGLDEVGPGVAYHYTHPEHVSEIEARGLLGCPVDGNLEATQQQTFSPAATNVDGAVFGYETLEDAADEGAFRNPPYDCVVLEVAYERALVAHHRAEHALPGRASSRTVIFLASEGQVTKNWGLAQRLSPRFRNIMR